jgi:hypothetical protein
VNSGQQLFQNLKLATIFNNFLCEMVQEMNDLVKRTEKKRGEMSYFEIAQIAAILDFLYKYNEFDNRSRLSIQQQYH